GLTLTGCYCLCKMQRWDEASIVLDVVFPAGRGLAAMIVFTDLGQKSLNRTDPNSEDSLICIAATIFKPQKYKQFCRAWEPMLKRWGASAFHATDFYAGGGEFKRNTPARQELFNEDSRRIPSMVGSKCEKVTLLAFKPKEYIAAAPPGWLALFGESVHSMGIQILLIAHGWWREERCPSQKFAYFMESGDPDENKVQETVRGM